MLTFAIRNLLSRKMRSLLSLLGLTVAIMGMVCLFSVAHGLEQQLTRTFGRIPGLAAMQPGAPIPLFSKLPARWGEEIADVEGVSVVMSEVWQRINVINQKKILSPPRFWFGYDIEHSVKLREDVYGRSIIEGRPLKLSDRGTRNCLISSQIADEFKVKVGDTLIVNDFEHKIVGVYETGSLLLDVAVVLDIDQVRQMTGFSQDFVTSFYIEPRAEADKELLTEQIKDRFRGRELPVWDLSESLMPKSPLDALTKWLGSLTTAKPKPDGQTPWPSDQKKTPATGSATAPGADSLEPHLLVERNMPIEVRTAQEWGKQFDKYAEDLDIVLMLLTGIGVTIAVLSIVNTMVMSVTERIIEIGILKANGWSKADVLKLITFESALIGFGGGMLGSFLGWIGTLIVNYNWPERVELYAGPGLLSFSVAFAVVLGIVGGLYPAVWAMRMMPMDAIRRG